MTTSQKFRLTIAYFLLTAVVRIAGDIPKLWEDIGELQVMWRER